MARRATKKAGPEVQTIRSPAGEEMVVLPRATYDALLARVGGGEVPIDDLVRIPMLDVRAVMAERQDAEDAADHARAMSDFRAGRAEALSDDEMQALLAAPSPLAFWRARRGLTQKELAAKVDVPQGYLSQIEAAKKTGSAETLKRLAEALGVDMEQLVV